MPNNTRNAIFSGIGFLINPLTQLAATPFLLGRLGSETYGIWMLLLIVVNVSASADFGVSPATTLFVAKNTSPSSRTRMLVLLQNSWAITVMAVALLVACLLVVMPVLLSRFAQLLSPGHQWALVAAFSLGCAAQFVQGFMDSALRGLQRHDIESANRAVTSLGTTSGVCLAVYLGGGIPSMVLAFFVISICGCLSASWLLIRQIHSIAWLLPRWEFSAVKSILSVGIYGWITTLSSLLFQQSDRIIIAAFLGPSQLAYYSACSQLAQISHSFLARSCAFLFPKFASISDEDISYRRSVFQRGMKLTSIVGCGIALFLFCFSDMIISLWLGNSVPQETAAVLRWLAFANGFFATTILPYYLLMGLGAFHITAIFALFSGILVTAAALYATPLAGAVGAAVARLAFLPASLLSRTISMRKAFGVGSWAESFSQLTPVLVGFSMSYLVIFYSHLQNNLGVSILALAAGFLGVAVSSHFIYGK